MERGNSRIIFRRIYFTKTFLWDSSYNLDNEANKDMLLLMMMMMMMTTTCHFRRRFYHLFFLFCLFLSFCRQVVFLQQNLAFGYTRSLCRHREQEAYWAPADCGLPVFLCGDVKWETKRDDFGVPWLMWSFTTFKSRVGSLSRRNAWPCLPYLKKLQYCVQKSCFVWLFFP